VEELTGQIQDTARTHRSESTSKMKCVLAAIYENNGKTILQPIVTEQEAKTIPELFNNKTLEVWLSNGKSDISQFDVAILKYNQTMQPLKKCKRTKTQVCLKNYFENLIFCEQCPLDANGEENQNDHT